MAYPLPAKGTPGSGSLILLVFLMNFAHNTRYMADASGIFERLVLTLESKERQEMLKQLADIAELQQEQARSERVPERAGSEGVLSPDAKLQAEPFLVRLWFSLLAFFSSTTPAKRYAKHLVSDLGRSLSKKYGQYIQLSSASYVDALYRDLLALKRTQDFFGSLLRTFDDDKGGFYIILGSLLMKRSCQELMEKSDPFTVPWDKPPGRDVRVSIMREMDVLFSGIPDEERARMYQAVQAIEWIRLFCSVPLDRMILRFGAVTAAEQTCLIESVTEEMQSLANVLSSARRIPVLLLEALYLFSVKDSVGEEKFDLEHECASFVTNAAAHLEEIRRFKSQVPVSDFVRYSLRDITWEPAICESGVDWFVLFRNAWKKRFDEKWGQWFRLHRRAMLERNMRSFLDAESLPKLQYHPWEAMWMPLSLRRELSLTFLKGIFASEYPAHLMKPLKILLIEGDFYRRENLTEYTDAFNTLEHQNQAIELFEARLSPKGDLGESFTLLLNEKIATVKGKARLEGLMLSVDSEVEAIINRTQGAFRSIDLILGGILGLVRGGPYETLSNISAIQGKLNERYRKDLGIVRQSLQNACGILSEAEAIEKESL